MSKEPKFCVDCCYYKNFFSEDRPLHKCTYYSTVSLVTGEPTPKNTFDCTEMRGSVSITGHGLTGWQKRFEPCGPDAKFFKPKSKGNPPKSS